MAVASRGDEVAGTVEREPPDLVILDLGLPGEDGFTVCRQLRLMYTNPILILTARDSDIDHVLGLELGADDYVVKPVEPRCWARIGDPATPQSRGCWDRTASCCNSGS